jgi:hypothetical protein
MTISTPVPDVPYDVGLSLTHVPTGTEVGITSINCFGGSSSPDYSQVIQDFVDVVSASPAWQINNTTVVWSMNPGSTVTPTP